MVPWPADRCRASDAQIDCRTARDVVRPRSRVDASLWAFVLVLAHSRHRSCNTVLKMHQFLLVRFTGWRRVEVFGGVPSRWCRTT